MKSGYGVCGKQNLYIYMVLCVKGHPVIPSKSFLYLLQMLKFNMQ